MIDIELNNRTVVLKNEEAGLEIFFGSASSQPFALRFSSHAYGYSAIANRRCRRVPAGMKEPEALDELMFMTKLRGFIRIIATGSN